eukprot:scpid35682/ scgid27380/ 
MEDFFLRVLLVLAAGVCGCVAPGGSANASTGVRAQPVSSSAVLPPNSTLCVDHAGGDLKMFVLDGADMALCYNACVSNAQCAGWIYMPPNCSFPSCPKGKAFCWLKSAWTTATAQQDCCRDSGFVRTPPPPPRPNPFPPFASCPGSPPLVQVTLDPGNVTHSINPMYRGCHLDIGYSHQPRPLYSQLIYSASYELGDPTAQWNAKQSPDGVGWVMYNESSQVQGQARLVKAPSAEQWNGHASMSLKKLDNSQGVFGMANRGLGHEGLVFEAERDYDGFVIVKPVTAVTLTLQIQDRSVAPPKVLATQDVHLEPSDWTKVPFNLTTTGGTQCVGIEPGSDPTVGCPVYNTTYTAHASMSDLTAHVCVKCGGQFVVGLRGAGEMRLGFTFLEPGQWARLENLNILKSGVQLLQDMGITAVRQGGSFADSSDYFWKNWIPRQDENMPLVRWGHDLESGWGPFHLIDMCNAIGIEPIVTTFAVPADPVDMADFVEYCYGNASTAWGRRRIEQGHPEPYRWKYIELGNEQYNYLFVDQVQAMEERAAALGLSDNFYYLFPQNSGVNATDQGRAKSLGIGDRLVVDIHDGPNGAVALSRDALQKFPTWGTANMETNCGDHTVHRMLEEAADLIDFFTAGIAQLHARAASFCFERSGYQEGGLNDQGISFFLPNMTWLQPPGYVHALISSAWQPNAAVSMVTGCESVRCGLMPCVMSHVQVSSDKTNATVYLLNMTPDVISANITFTRDWQPSTNTLHGWTISSNNLQQANTPAEPAAVSPQPVVMDTTQVQKIPAQSFTIVTTTVKQ